MIKNLIQDQPKWWRAGKDCRNSKLSLEIGNVNTESVGEKVKKDNQILDQPKWWRAGCDSKMEKI